MPARLLFLFLALATALLATSARGADLGTLFFTPAEREQLDRLRRGEPAEEAPAASAASHQVTGYVQRSDGRDTVWIDGRAVRVAGPQAKGVFDPRSVRDYSRSADAVKIERTPKR